MISLAVLLLLQMMLMVPHRRLAIGQLVVSFTFLIVQILVHSHFKLDISPLALDATEPVSQPVTQMAVELI